MEEGKAIVFETKIPENMQQSELLTMILAVKNVDLLINDDRHCDYDTYREMVNGNLDVIIAQAQLMKIKEI